MGDNPLVYLIVLNFNGHKDTIECVNSLKNISYKNYKIIIVDNNSTDDSEEILKEKFSEYIFIQTGKNLGYAGGNNYGINYALKHNADYICILNNDTIVSENYLSELVSYMENNINCGMIGPAILESNSEDIIQSTGGVVNLLKGDVLPINNGKALNQVDSIINCDYVGGACILVRCEVIKKIGLIPEAYFLFFEETEWCYHAKNIGYSIICLTKSHVFHKGSISINTVLGLSEYLMERNRIVFVKRNADILTKFGFYIFLTVKIFCKCAFKNIKYIRYMKYYFHGIFNIVDKKYPFIYLRN